MNIADFSELKDHEKLILGEHFPGMEVQEEGWTATGGGSFYIDFDEGEVLEIRLDDADPSEVFTVAACDAAADTWYYNDLIKRLYVHATDGDDPGTQNPDTSYKYCIVVIFRFGVVNRQDKDNQVIYEPEKDLLQDGGFNFWSSGTLLKYWTESIAVASTITRDSAEVYDENSAFALVLTIDGAGSLASVKQEYTTKPRRKNRVELWYKMTLVGDGATIRIYDQASNVWLDLNAVWQAGATDITLPNSLVWVKFELDFVAHTSYSDYFIEIRSVTANSVIYFDYGKLYRIRQPIYYKPYLALDSISPIYQGVGDFYIADIRVHAGGLSEINDGFFYEKKETWRWHNKRIEIKVGAVGSDYDELAYVFRGITQNPIPSDESMGFDILDTRVSDLTMIPRERFDITTYPNIDSSSLNQAIPILFGEKTGIVPVLEDTANRIYRVTQTVFNAVTYAQESLDAVYADGVTLTGGGVDYNTDLNNGRFTLLIDPGSALITCDAKGIKCDLEDGSYSYLAADWYWFALSVVNSVDELDLNMATFWDLKANRTQKMGAYLASEIETLEFFKNIKKSTINHLFPLLDGSFVAKRYATGIDDDTPRFRNEDYTNYSEPEPTESGYKAVILKYDQEPRDSTWKQVTDENADTLLKNDIDAVLIVETYLINSAEAEAIRDFYIRLIKNPARKLITILPERANLINPADKGVFSRTIIRHDGTEVTLLEDEVYRILELTKDITSGQADIVAIRDMQSVGFDIHSDVAHEDSYIDEHEDSHEDAAHTDSHTDSAHSDSYDDSHTDDPHQDSYSDSHEDTTVDNHGDAYLDYYDLGYMDHHTDTYSDYHEDSHSDNHTDVAHSDSYTDSYTDSAHGDAYTDVGHTDLHSDSHVDEHTDEAHVDSYV